MIRSMLIQRYGNQDGFVVVTAIIVMTLMLSIGLAAYAIVDTQQSQSRQQRERESSFNITEGALTAQGVNLPATWPSSNATGVPYPAECTQASTDSRCPTAAQIAASFNASEFSGCVAPNCSWRVRVRDNGTFLTGTSTPAETNNPPKDYTSVTDGAACRNSDGSLVSPSTTPCTYDANGDNQLWVRADGVVRGRKRQIVALLKLEAFPESFPHSVILAGSIAIIPNGNQTYVQTNGSSPIVRCNPTGSEPDPSGDCLAYDTSKPQVSPDSSQSVPSSPPALTSAALARFRDTAARSSTCGATHNQPCLKTPSNDNECKDIDIAGAPVYIEPTNPNVRCKIASNTNINALGNYGFLIMTDGILDLSGTITYFGVLYHTNGCSADEGTGCADSIATPCKEPIQTSGGLSITGAVAIDGCGKFRFGSTNGVLSYDANAFATIESNGVAGLVQNTWRELPANF